MLLETYNLNPFSISTIALEGSTVDIGNYYFGKTVQTPLKEWHFVTALYRKLVTCLMHYAEVVRALWIEGGEGLVQVKAEM